HSIPLKAQPHSYKEQALLKMGFSDICFDLTTYWDSIRKKCVPCETKAGYEVTKNCGRDDEGGVHTNKFTPCKPDTFNDGTSAHCRSCSTCPPGTFIRGQCTSTSDTICEEDKNASQTPPTPAATLESRTTTHATAPSSTTATMYQTTNLLVTSNEPHAPLWPVPIAVIAFFMLVATVFALKMKNRRGVCKNVCCKRRASYKGEGFSPISSSGSNSEVLEDILDAKILAAPLHTVLDDLDVLEELVILLDPDTQGIKSTKHLASLCSFPSTWITYTYSMKDSKSPLKAVLEGVTSKQPDWTVAHLAQLLRQMGRNDALAVLIKLRPGPHAGYV
ncbi:IGF-like family receptor 1, partial [Fundulus heteroclitus]|uniref:IGF-like family receptor 1 n=1 Tax=Fundulus heteroclitus TaxID=8078 RepID=UPI00165B28FA